MPLISLEVALSQSFDYIIVEVSTAGLVVATRLSEDSNTSVLVLDAGLPNLDEPLITRMGQYGFQFGNPQFDWGFKTVPQKHVQGNQYPWNRGKSLGGSSAMNFSGWSVPPQEDINDWERLGNPGWNWNTYQKYHDKAVTYVPLEVSTRPDLEFLKTVWDIKNHSSGSGPLLVTHPRVSFEIDRKIHEALDELGVEKARAPIHGDPKGHHVMLSTVDPHTHQRAYSATAYFKPASARPNLFVLSTAYAHKIVTEEQENKELAATGVEFSYGDDKSIHVTRATREVVVSAGALKSPQILELSGIGREDVLNRIGVPVKVPLAGVGENVQDHILLSAAYELKESAKTETLDVLRDEKEVPRQIELLTRGEGAYATGITNIAWVPFSDITTKADALYEQQGRRIREDAKNGVYPPGLTEQYEVQLQRFQDRAYLSEFANIPGFFALDKPPIPGKKYFAFFAFLNHPFTRGAIHASSNDPFVHPDMDPRYWEHEIDKQALIEGIKYVRKIVQTTALRDEIGRGIVSTS
ncbi:hypothetical protein PQX77_017641 [Marasmius sp. AFHP31]|nr:hypothetical protein PQX77_017641 [Marasmius sp. AFHP31]